MQNNQTTVQAACSSKEIVVDGKPVTIYLWDTAGQEKFQAVAQMYYRNAAAALLVFDVTDIASFTGIERWYEKISQPSNADTVLFLVGSKCDIAHRQVEKVIAQTYATKKRMNYVETSAKTGDGINQLFNDAVVKTRLVKVGSKVNEQIIVTEGENIRGGCC